MEQTTYNMWDWVLPLISGAIGALIGTYGGSYFLYWKQEKKIKNVRTMAVKALDVFKAYAKKSYIETVSEFNNKLTISEKRAIVVALHKIGVPFEMPTKDAFDVRNLRLKDIVIDKDEIDGMIQQIEKGNCDNLFFEDIESYFTSNLRLNAVRNVGKKYVEETLSKSYLRRGVSDQIVRPDEWYKSYTPGELQTIFVLSKQLANASYFLSDGKIDREKVGVLTREIEIGLWDTYLFWEYESYQNIRAQYDLANVIQNVVMGQQTMNAIPQTAEEASVNNE